MKAKHVEALRHFIVLILTGTCFVLMAGCDSYPKDPRESLQHARQSGLKVGAIASPPWVEIKNGQVNGVEADLIKGFARSLNTEVEWMTGSESEILPILEQGELQIAIGGLTSRTPWRKRVGLTGAYKKENVIACSTKSNQVPGKIEHLPVAVRSGSAIIAEVKKKGGTPVIRNSLAGYQGLVAVYERDAEQVGCGLQNLRLTTEKHVMAVPKGENALLVTLERYLNEQGY